MDAFTMDDLVRVMRAAAGEDESASLEGDISETSFVDLGYDSLAVIETTSRIEREFGLTIPEEEMAEIDTPGQLVDFVNNRLATAA